MTETIKNTNKDFENFKKECLRLQKEWGLTEWKLNFEFKEEPDFEASIAPDCNGSIATILKKSNIKEQQKHKKNRLTKHLTSKL